MAHGMYNIIIVSNKVIEKVKTRVLFAKLSRKSCRLWDNVKKCGRAGQATEDNIIECRRVAGWITNVYKDTLRICNTYCFSTATMVMRTCYNVTFVHCLSSYMLPIPRNFPSVIRTSVTPFPHIVRMTVGHCSLSFLVRRRTSFEN